MVHATLELHVYPDKPLQLIIRDNIVISKGPCVHSIELPWGFIAKSVAMKFIV